MNTTITKNKNLKAYEIVLKDMKKNHKKCPDYSMGCFGCAHQRLIEDLESYMELIDDSKWTKIKR